MHQKKKKEAKKEAEGVIKEHKALDWINFANPQKLEYTLEFIHDTKHKKIEKMKKLQQSASANSSPNLKKKKKK